MILRGWSVFARRPRLVRYDCKISLAEDFVKMPLPVLSELDALFSRLSNGQSWNREYTPIDSISTLGAAQGPPSPDFVPPGQYPESRRQLNALINLFRIYNPSGFMRVYRT